MFFIFGSPRSGTTLLATTLDQHSRIVVPPETDFIVPLALMLERIPDAVAGRALAARFIVSTARFRQSIGELLSAADVEQAVAGAPYSPAGMLEAVYAAVAIKARKQLAGDKSPNDLAAAFLLRRAGVFDSEVKVIHLVRDVRDVALSMRAVGWDQQPELGFASAWSVRNVALHQQLRHEPRRYRLVKFEELVRDPPGVVAQLTGFLGVPFEPAMLAHEDRGLRYRDDAHHRNLGQPFLAGKAQAWRHEPDSEWLRLCEENAREGLRLFGYLDS